MIKRLGGNRETATWVCVGALILGVGLGMLFGNIAVGTLIGLGAGLVLRAIVLGFRLR